MLAKMCDRGQIKAIVDAKGTPIAAAYSKEVDSHGNVQLSGTGALGDLLVKVIKEKTKISRVRADTFGYLQRSFPGLVSKNDAKEAFQAGVVAVKLATSADIDGSVAIRRLPGTDYKVKFERVELRQVAKNTRCLPDAFIAKNGHDVTPAFVKYAAPIVGELPAVGRFAAKKVKKV